MNTRTARTRVTELRLTVLALAIVTILLMALGQVDIRPASAQQASPSPTATDDGGLTEGGVGGADAPDAPGEGTVSGGATDGLTMDLGLDLAHISDVNLDDDEEEFVVYVFDDFVREIADASGFSVRGFNVASTAAASSASLIEDSQHAVLVAFPAGTDLRQYTIATVGADAVRNETGRGNVPSTVALQGSAVAPINGRTAGPELIAVDRDATLDRVTYTFDEEIAPDAGPQAAGFGYVTTAGEAVPAERVVTVDDEQVTVAFGDDINDGERFYTLAGAVSDRQGIANPAGAIGSATTAPDLVDARRAGGRTIFDYTFNEPVTDVDPGAFALYSDSGAAYQAEDWVRVDADTVRVIVPAVREFGETIVLATVGAGAAVSEDSARTPSTVGAAAIGSNGSAPGLTSGPDLVGVQVETSTGLVRFVFDELLDDDASVDADGFRAVTRSGRLVPARMVAEIHDHTVLVAFDSNIVQSRDGFVVSEGSVRDNAGDANPSGSL